MKSTDYDMKLKKTNHIMNYNRVQLVKYCSGPADPDLAFMTT